MMPTPTTGFRLAPELLARVDAYAQRLAENRWRSCLSGRRGREAAGFYDKGTAQAVSELEQLITWASRGRA